MSRTQISELYLCFRIGQISVEDFEYSGHWVWNQTDKSV
jgi:hypothetical protein